MTDDRPPIPRPLDRAVRVEAGHRCAIPSCRATSGLQVHHIDPWSKVKEHTFHNLILLCSNCHSRVTNKEIDRQAVLQYKANLSVVNGRYGDLERRVLGALAGGPEGSYVDVLGGNEIMLHYALEDGLIEEVHPERPAQIVFTGQPYLRAYGLTAAGREFTERWMNAEELE